MSMSRSVFSAFSRQTFTINIAAASESSQLRFICSSCRRGLNFQIPRHVPNPSRHVSRTTPKPSSTLRSLSTSPSLQKKSSASKKSSKPSPEVSSPSLSTHIPNNKATQSRDAEIDPYDYSTLSSAIDSALSRLKESLLRTRDAGRVTSEMIESLPIELNIKHDKTNHGTAHHERTQIKDLGSVVPKGGRTMQIYISSEEHVKPISNAIAASEHSLVPQVDEQNPLLLIVPVPPATAETRKQAAAEAKKVIEKASLDVRNARGDAQKRFRKMELEKLVIKDELVKAHKGMEEVVRKGQDEVKRLFEQAIKSLQQ